MDLTNEFDKRLASMSKARNCGIAEIDAAVMTYERLKTARIIVAELLGDMPGHAAVLSVFSELGAEARSRQGVCTDA